MPYATINDVADELGRPVPDGLIATQWEAWIGRVERAIARAFRHAGLDLSGQVMAGAVSLEDVADVVAVRVAARALVGDDLGATSSTISVDDATVTTRREGEQLDPLALTDDDLAALLPRGGSSGAFSVRPTYSPGFAGWP